MLQVELTPDGKRATGVTYVNSAGEEFFQPADMVILSRLHAAATCGCCCCRASASRTTRRPARAWSARNYAYQTMASVNVFFDDKIFNPFIGAGALATVIDDFNGDNFDHAGARLHRRRATSPA